MYALYNMMFWYLWWKAYTMTQCSLKQHFDKYHLVIIVEKYSVIFLLIRKIRECLLSQAGIVDLII